MEYLEGKLLVAMPGLVEPTFAQSVIFLCAHSREGAMGLIINKLIPGASFTELTDKLDLSKADPGHIEKVSNRALHMGGPVDSQRGFVLHDGGYEAPDGSLRITGNFGLTATIDVLQDIADDRGPTRYLLALGYSGWAAGQLEREIANNGWLHCDADATIVFADDNSTKHRLALQKIGIDPLMLSSTAGHA